MYLYVIIDVDTIKATIAFVSREQAERSLRKRDFHCFQDTLWARTEADANKGKCYVIQKILLKTKGQETTTYIKRQTQERVVAR